MALRLERDRCADADLQSLVVVDIRAVAGLQPSGSVSVQV